MRKTAGRVRADAKLRAAFLVGKDPLRLRFDAGPDPEPDHLQCLAELIDIADRTARTMPASSLVTFELHTDGAGVTGAPAPATVVAAIRLRIDQRWLYRTADTSWSGKIALDTQIAVAACSSCHILLVEANNDDNSDLDIAVDYAAGHAQVASNSYGSNESSIDISTDGPHCDHPGVSVLSPSGDSGYGAEFPAASPTVIAVGGTNLTTATVSRSA